MNCTRFVIGLALALVVASSAVAQTPKAEEDVITLSRAKWQWMADKAVDKLEPLFHDTAKFVHMSGTWKKDRELEIIKSGSIWYKQADVHDVAATVVDDTALVWSRITLTAVVRGADAKNEFTVTEVCRKVGNDWKMLALTFSSVRPEHQLQK